MKKAIAALAAILVIAVIAVFALESKLNAPDPAADTDQTPSKVAQRVEDDPGDQDVELEDDPTTKNYDNGIVYEDETEGSQVHTEKSGPEGFIGSWTAKSGQAAYFYGNVDIKIDTNGTWKGNITEEELRGKWIEKDGGLYLTSEIFNCTLKKSPEGHLIMQEDIEDSDEEGVIVVLTRK